MFLGNLKRFICGVAVMKAFKVCVWDSSEESIFTYVDHFCMMVNLY
jgi:hypothetical protein